jgi:UDP-2,3-diacylglucosamine pyrophosphatase LpxH
LRCVQKIEERAVEAARKQHCTAVCCGHTHHAILTRRGGIQYINSGCWTESPGTYVTVAGGLIELHAFEATAVVEHEIDFAGNLLAS